MSGKRQTSIVEEKTVKKQKVDGENQIGGDLLEEINRTRINFASSVKDFKFNKKRIKVLTEAEDIPESAKCVIYWMSRDQRIQDNWAFLYAQKLAFKLDIPLCVCFCLVPKFLDATIRHYRFMLKGLQEVEKECKSLNIHFHLLSGEAKNVLPKFVEKNHVGAVVTDFCPLRVPLQWVADVSSKLPPDVPLCQVDAHNIVPCWIASDKLEYGARTIRKKIHDKLKEFLTEFPPVIKQKDTAECELEKIDWEAVEKTLEVNMEVSDVSWATPGATAGLEQVADFCKNRLKNFHDCRNDPTKQNLSNLSPWFHFGQISVQRAILIVKSYRSKYPESVDAFIEESVVRRELADNFCYYNKKYDQVAARAKKFAIVAFVDDETESVDVIPTKWIISDTEAKWPNVSPGTVSKYIIDCKDIENEWTVVKIKIYGYSNCIKKARKKANLAVDTSSIGSDSSEDDKSVKRKIKKPNRYNWSDEESVSIIENSSKKAQKKVNVAIDTLSIGSDSSEDEKPVKRRIKKPNRYNWSDEESVSIIENSSKSVQKKGPLTMNASSIGLDSCADDTPVRRIIKKPARYNWSDEDSSTVADNFKNKATKMNHLALNTSKNCSDSSEDNTPVSRYKNPDRCNDNLSISRNSRRNSTSSKETTPNIPAMCLNGIEPSRMSSNPNISTLSNAIDSSRMSTSPTNIISVVHHRSTQTSDNTLNNIEDMFDQVIRYNEIFNEQLNAMNSKIASLTEEVRQLKNCKGEPETFGILPEDVDLPVTTYEELHNLDSRMQREESFSITLISYFKGYGCGKTLRAFMLNIMKRLLDKRLAANFSLYGKKGKHSFTHFSATFNVLLSVASFRFPNSSRDELIDVVGRHLASAKDWDGRDKEQ